MSVKTPTNFAEKNTLNSFISGHFSHLKPLALAAPVVLLAACGDTSSVTSAVNAGAIADNVATTQTLLPGPDTDGDGLRNQEDLDDDNDGIPDIDEGLSLIHI